MIWIGQSYHRGRTVLSMQLVKIATSLEKQRTGRSDRFNIQRVGQTCNQRKTVEETEPDSEGSDGPTLAGGWGSDSPDPRAQQRAAQPVCPLARVGQSDPAHAGSPRAARKLQTSTENRSNELQSCRNFVGTQLSS